MDSTAIMLDATDWGTAECSGTQLTWVAADLASTLRGC